MAVWSVLHCIHLRVNRGTIITANILVVCVTSKRERERENTATEDKASAAEMLPLYPLEITQSWKILLVVYLYSY